MQQYELVFAKAGMKAKYKNVATMITNQFKDCVFFDKDCMRNLAKQSDCIRKTEFWKYLN